jgi:hypothetical protein
MNGEWSQRTWSCPSDFTLERLRQRELVGPAAEAASGHVGGCVSCGGRLEALAAPPPALDLEAIWRRAQSSWRGRLANLLRFRFVTVTLAATTASLALWFAGPAQTITKGPPWTLSLIARSGDGSVARIAPGAALHRGDRLRFEVSTTWSSGHVVLLSLDSRGKVSLLAPSSGEAVTVPGGKRTLLEGAVELDDAVGAERVLLVACHRKVPVGLVADTTRAALAQAGGDPRGVTGLGLGCHEESFWITKVSR